LLASLFAASGLARAEETSREGALAIKEGNRLLDEGKYGEALAAYDKAHELMPDLPEVAYNRGIALYRLGKYADAEKTLQDALQRTRPELEAKAKYNLGRCAHASAIQNKDKTEEAINDLTKAIGFYNDALQIMPEDEEAKKNKQLAEGLRDYLQKVLEKQQQEKKKEPSSQPSSQPNDEQTSQPSEQPSSQPSSQPSEQKEGEGEDEKDEKDSDKQDSNDKKGQSKKQDGQKDSADKSGDQNQSSEGDEQEGAQEQQEKEMSEGQASAMLQEARDMEHKRREAKRAMMLRVRGRIPVDKDW
jgi:tetratricopeptide (TPR) repeat protein